MLNRRSVIAGLAAVPLAMRPALARAPDVHAADGIAIGGADAVAYFQVGGAVAGLASHALMWRGATWLFASATTMDAFEMDPARYCPAYGGYCAHAMAQGHLSPTVPPAFTIHQDRLFLNFSLEVRSLWRADIAGQILRADRHWPTILHH